MLVNAKGKFVSDRAIAEIFYRLDQKMCSYGAWHWLLSKAAFKDHQINYKGRIILIKRGQIPTSYRKLSESFGWSINRLRRFLQHTQRGKHIDISADTGFIIITLCNYDQIQKFGESKDTEMNTVKDPLMDTKVDTTAATNRTNGGNETNLLAGSSALRASTHATPPDEFKTISQWHVLLKDKLGEPVYKSWIEQLDYEDGHIICHTRFIRDWCEDNYYDLIQSAIEASGKKFIGFKLRSLAQ